ncbi:MAG: DUF2911 domain-containing protein, partial [Calditrichaeota bacterium]|nr:DUF2911 domain-containing protein [Calditrichota bacterium]
MKRNTLPASAMKLFLLLLINQLIVAQGSDGFIVPRTNSKAVVRQTIASTQIEIKYNRPNKHDRTIFGGLVPFDK